MRVTWICLSLLMLASLPGHLPAEEASVEPQTTASISWQVGALPYHCISLPLSGQNCAWRVHKEMANWAVLSEQFETEEAFDLRCKRFFSKDACGKLRAGNGFNLHCDRLDDKASGRAPTCTPYVEIRAQPVRVRPVRQREARSLIDATKDLPDVIYLVGDLPTLCTEDQSHIICEWESDSRTPGHVIMAVAVVNSTNKKTRMVCRFILSGQFERDGSCKLSILS